MTQPRLIVGAGLAGLIAAHAWPSVPLLEAAPQPAQAHRALLRFRSDAVARLTGIEFRKVRVHKGIWFRGSYVAPDIAMANLYAHKCLGRLVGDRSIWNIDPVERFIAPDDFYGQLLQNVGQRIMWGKTMDWNDCNPFAELMPIISTAPLPEVIKAISGLEFKDIEFHRAPIHVLRFELEEGADLYQTVYFPDDRTQLYRASITGSTLIAEFADGAPEEGDEWPQMIDAAFGLEGFGWYREFEGTTQRYGKIAPIDDATRRSLLFSLTNHHNVYSLGRFATWRNLLLDDVVDDIAVVKRLMRTADKYELRKSA